jgi:LPS export ABC transporter protein LptC
MRTIALLASAISLVAVAACHDSKAPPVAAGPSVADSADQILFGMQYLLSTKGIQRGDLRADTAFVMADQSHFDLRRAHVTFTTETGAPQGTMEGNRGVYNTQTQVLEGWGNVIVKLVDGRTLESPHVVFNQLTHQLSSDTNYTIHRGPDTQSGIGFTSNQTFTNFSCLKSCTGQMSILFPEK